MTCHVLYDDAGDNFSFKDPRLRATRCILHVFAGVLCFGCFLMRLRQRVCKAEAAKLSALDAARYRCNWGVALTMGFVSVFSRDVSAEPLRVVFGSENRAGLILWGIL